MFDKRGLIMNAIDERGASIKGLVVINGIYRTNINYKGKQRSRSTRTGHLPAAVRILKLRQGRCEQLLAGLVALSPGVGPWDYIFEGVTEKAKALESHPAEPSITIGDFQQEYTASLGPPKISKVFAKTQTIYLGHFARFRGMNPDLPQAMKDWQSRHIEKYRLWRLGPNGRNNKGREVRGITVRKEVSSIGKMFDHARRQGLIGQNPCHDLEPIPDDAPDATFRTTEEIVALERSGHMDGKESAGLRRKWLLSVLEVEELKALMWRSACNHYMERPGDSALVIHIAADAGLRLGEIGRLATRDIGFNPDQRTGIITARSRKQSRRVVEKERHVPITGELVRRLADWLKGLSGRRLFHECAEEVFRADFYRALDAATRGTKFAGFRPHLLRHALRTNLYEAGVDEKLIDAWLGHTTSEMGDHYRHIRAKRLADGAKAYEEARARAAAEAVRGISDESGASIRSGGAPPGSKPEGGSPVFQFSLQG